MKYMTLAVLALIGEVTPASLNRLHNSSLLQEKSFQEVTLDDDGFIVLGEKTVVRQHKESEELCDGDAADDKEVEDVDDAHDHIVDDSGFVHKWLQTSAQIRRGKAHKKESDELCDGDAADDREVEDVNDAHDDIVDDNGFVHKWVQTSAQLGRYSDEVANGDTADDRDIHEDEDMNDDVVDVNGQTNAGYGSKMPVDFFAGNHIADGHFLTEPRNVQLSAHIGKYSDELANGDTADDRDIHEDEDMNDDVVDVNGQTNAGYGSKMPVDFFAGNHIADGHFLTEPRLVQLEDDNLLQLDESHEIEKGHWWGQIQALAQKKTVL